MQLDTAQPRWPQAKELHLPLIREICIDLSKVDSAWSTPVLGLPLRCWVDQKLSCSVTSRRLAATKVQLSVIAASDLANNSDLANKRRVGLRAQNAHRSQRKPRGGIGDSVGKLRDKLEQSLGCLQPCQPHACALITESTLPSMFANFAHPFIVAWIFLACPPSYTSICTQ